MKFTGSLLLVSAVASAPSKLKFQSGSLATKISFENNELSVGDAGVCVKIAGLAG
jgi:hypothetical protein